MGVEPKFDLSGAVDAPLPLTRFKANHASPFWSSADGQCERLEEAHALLTIIADGFKCDDDGSDAEGEGISRLRPMILGQALAGIQTLVAMSLYHNEIARKA